MALLISYFLAATAALFSIPVAFLLLEVLAAIAAPGKRPPPSFRRGQRVAVLVPAYNEGQGIAATLSDITAQMQGGDRVVVIADNCSDDTAAVATAGGAEVIERHDPDKTGKGYALDFGIRHLRHDPPAVVMIIDADCRLSIGLIERLASVCEVSQRPVQALDLMTAPHTSAVNYRVAEFAWLVKNRVRPLGLSVLGLPCQLMGTGMAFPWHVIDAVNLASASIVEDLKLGLDLARDGHPALFCPDAVITSQFPSSLEGAQNQRKRWEQGHIGLIANYVPHFLAKALRNFDIMLLTLTLDLMIPPLSVLSILVVALSFLTAVSYAFFDIQTGALILSGGVFCGFVLAIFLSWFKFGQNALPPGAIWSVIPYVAAKLPVYWTVFSSEREKKWRRADRDRHKKHNLDLRSFDEGSF